MEHIKNVIAREGRDLSESVLEEMLEEINLPKEGIISFMNFKELMLYWVKDWIIRKYSKKIFGY